MVVVPFAANDTVRLAAFQHAFRIDDETRLTGPFDGKLNNNGEQVRLEFPDHSSRSAADELPYVAMDSVSYDDNAPWPVLADVGGHSLNRINESSLGNTPFSWLAAPPTPGSYVAVQRVPGDANHDGQFDQLDILRVLQSAKYLSGEPAFWDEGDWNVDGVFDQEDIVAVLQADSYLKP